MMPTLLVLPVRAEEQRRDLRLSPRCTSRSAPGRRSRCRAPRVGAAIAHALADGVAAEIELLRERLVDDRDLRRAERVGARELAPASSGMPSVGSSPGRPRCSASSCRCPDRLEALDRDVAAPVAAGEQRHRRRRHAGRRPAARASSSSSGSNSCARPLRRVAVQLRRDAERDDVVDVQAEIDAADVDQALGEQPGRHEQRHRQRDLRRRQRRRKRAADRAPDGWPACPSAPTTRSGRVLCSAGNRPKSSPVPT